jgi:hypothetical protein
MEKEAMTSTVKDHKPGILATARSEGYRDGFSQASQCAHDDAYIAGELAARKATDGEHKKWWAFGVLCGVGASAIVGAFL